MVYTKESESPNTEIDPERAIEHVKKNRQKAKDFADKIRNGYVPEKRLKDEIVEKIYDTLTGSHEKPSYDDLVELRNYLQDAETDSDVQDKRDSKSLQSPAIKPEVRIEGHEDKVSNNASKSKHKDSNSPDSNTTIDHAENDHEDVEGKDYFMHDFHKPLGSVMFSKDRTCVNEDGEVIGLWNEDGKVRDPNGKQIGHLPSNRMDEFNSFLDALGIKHSKGFEIRLGNYKFL